jgi:hypothetical protein
MIILSLGKVRLSGPGIEHGVLSTFQSHFVCETKGAGKFEKICILILWNQIFNRCRTINSENSWPERCFSC